MGAGSREKETGRVEGGRGRVGQEAVACAGAVRERSRQAQALDSVARTSPTLTGIASMQLLQARSGTRSSCRLWAPAESPGCGREAGGGATERWSLHLQLGEYLSQLLRASCAGWGESGQGGRRTLPQRDTRDSSRPQPRLRCAWLTGLVFLHPRPELRAFEPNGAGELPRSRARWGPLRSTFPRFGHERHPRRRARGQVWPAHALHLLLLLLLLLPHTYLDTQRNKPCASSTRLLRLKALPSD